MAVPHRHQGWLCCAQPPVTTSEEGSTISNPSKHQNLAFLNHSSRALLQILDCSAHDKDDRTGEQGKGIFSTGVTTLGGVKPPAKDLLITLLILQAQAGHCHLNGHGSPGHASSKCWGLRGPGRAAWGREMLSYGGVKALIGLVNCREGQTRPVG